MNWNNRKADDPIIVPCIWIGFLIGINEGDVAELRGGSHYCVVFSGCDACGLGECFNW